MATIQPRYVGGSGGSKGKKGRPIALVVVVVLVVGIALAGGWYVFPRPSPEKTMEQFMEASERGDQEALKSCLSAKSQKTRGFSQMMAMPTGGPGKKKGEPDYTIGKATIEGKIAIVPVTYKMPEEAKKFGFGDDLTLKYGLVKEGRAWKVDFEETEKVMMEGFSEMFKDMPDMPEGFEFTPAK